MLVTDLAADHFLFRIACPFKGCLGLPDSSRSGESLAQSNHPAGGQGGQGLGAAGGPAVGGRAAGGDQAEDGGGLVDGRLRLRDQDIVLCYDLRPASP